jgi:hypothetical protein
MNKNKEALDELMNGIKYLIDNSKDNGTLVLNGIIQSANADKTYNVKINGIIYENISSILIPLAVGNVVKVIVPQGQYSQMIIIGKINTNSGGGEDPYVLPQATTKTLGGVYVDNAMSSTSENPVQNKVVKSAIDAIDSAIIYKQSTNYSTSEQIVGTWIDGKPLYQKTIYYDTQIGQNGSFEILHGISNLKEVMKCDFMTKRQDSFHWEQYNVAQRGSGEYARYNISEIAINLSKNLDATSVVIITMQYTKTTD